MKRFRSFLLIIILVAATSLSGCDDFFDMLDELEGMAGDELDDVYSEEVEEEVEDEEIADEEEGEVTDEDPTIEDTTDDEADEEIELPNEHICTFGEWTMRVEPTCKTLGELIRECVDCDEVQTESVNMLPHTPTPFEEISAGCETSGFSGGEFCLECKTVLKERKTLSPIGHIEVIDASIPATPEAPGKTEGAHCSVCGVVTVVQKFVYYDGYSTPDRYSGDYAYEYLLTIENAESLAALYGRIDEGAMQFHSSDEDAKEKNVSDTTVYVAFEVKYSDLSLSTDEALAVWYAYIIDHPLFYWMSNEISYNTRTMSVLSYEEFSDAEVRGEYNARLYAAAREYVLSVDGVGSIYSTALAFHDMIIENADYAYLDDGVTPDESAFAHSIIGVMLLGEGVCESYAKAFQLLLNYCGMDNVYVKGTAGGSHAWNLLELDDGSWYWFDLTWDDRAGYGVGVVHNYFCITDGTVVNYLDGGQNENPVTMIEEHIPAEYGSMGVKFFYPLPERAESEFDHDGYMVRDEVIVVDGLSYVIIGYDSVALVKIEKEGDVIIPESIVCEGRVMRVTCIGAYEDGLFCSGSIIELLDSQTYATLEITSVFIPKTVRFIWDFAFAYGKSIEKFEVDTENEYFTSLGGVLFTKSLYTLIAYPLASKNIEYVVPEETVEIAFFAFGDGGNVFCPKALKLLVIGDGVDVIGAGNLGGGYRDSAPASPEEIVILDGYLGMLYAMFGFGLRI